MYLCHSRKFSHPQPILIIIIQLPFVISSADMVQGRASYFGLNVEGHSVKRNDSSNV